jgi:hypothetical protein
MAIDPRISLAVQTPQASQAINIFENALMNKQTRGIRAQQAQIQAEQAPLQNQILQQQLAAGEAQAAQAQDQRILKSINDFAVTNQHIIDEAERSGDFAPLQKAMVQRRAQLVQSGLPTDETDEAILSLGQGDIQSLDIIDQLRNSRELFQQQSGVKGTRSFAPITDPNTGQVSIPTVARDGSVTLKPIEGAIQLTPAQKSDREFVESTREADLEVETTKRKETIKKTVQRTSDLKSNFSKERRASKKSLRKLSEVNKLAEKATQGIAGAGKLLAARFLPGIDASDEAGLSSAFKGLALDELSKFTGPTTDFEFRVTEDIAGALGDGASANRARVASLQRAAWFTNKEALQFDKWIDDGHNPDRFAYNNLEPVTFGKGDRAITLTLQDIQDSAVAAHVSIEEAMRRLNKSRGGK